MTKGTEGKNSMTTHSLTRYLCYIDTENNRVLIIAIIIKELHAIR